MRRINLLPREIEERRRARRQVSLLVVLFLVWVVLLVAFWFVRQQELRREEERLADAQARVQALEARRRQLQEFAILEQTVRQKEATLKTAMAGDVAWSRLLIELSMIIPGDSWISSFTGAAAAPAPGAAPPAGPPRLGNVTFAATTFNFPGVANWLTRLAELKSLQDVWVPGASKGTIGTRQVVNFSSTADLAPGAASGRFQQ